jgi:hypothetical protein
MKFKMSSFEARHSMAVAGRLGARQGRHHTARRNEGINHTDAASPAASQPSSISGLLLWYQCCNMCVDKRFDASVQISRGITDTGAQLLKIKWWRITSA